MKVFITLLLAAVFCTPSFAQLKDTLLKEVVIKARKPLLVHAIDRTIVNVDAMIGSAASNTLEVLEKTPGVTVNNNGEISLNGRNGVTVLINGRPTYMSGSDLAAYLKSLPGASLDKIELMDNPPARYDAAGNAIINIRLKRNRAGGFTGNISTAYSQGKYARMNDAINLNYNTRKINLFSNIGYNNDRSYNNDRYDRRFYAADGQLLSRVLLENNQTSKGNGTNANMGMDYNVSAKTTLGVMFNVNKGQGNQALEYIIGHFKGYNISENKRTNLGANLNMLHRFNDKGHELTIDANYLNYRSDGTQDMERFFYQLSSDINIYSANADYTLPLKNKTKFDAGVKSSIIHNGSLFDYYDVDGAIQTPDQTKSNHFNYDEHISAAYINFQKSWGRFGAQAGLRAEHTRARGKQQDDAAPGDLFTKNYTQLFPSLFLNYKLDSLGNNTLGFVISRRINRPNYQLLNLFLFFRDQYSYTGGNPLLNPQYQYRYELKYQHKQFLTLGLSYNKFTNVIFQTTEAVDSILITRPQNIAMGYMLLLNMGVNLSPAKWWRIDASLKLVNLGIRGRAYTENLTPTTNAARFEWRNNFQVNNTVNTELGGYYASRDLTGQTFTKGMYRLYAGMQKKILKDKAAIRINIEDIFHSWKYSNQSISLKQAEYFQTSESDTRRVSLGFTYSFGKKSNVRKRNSNTINEEKGRIE